MRPRLGPAPGLPPPFDQVAVAAEGGVEIAAPLPQGHEGDVREAAGEPRHRRGVLLDAPSEEPLGLLVVDAHQQLAQRVYRQNASMMGPPTSTARSRASRARRSPVSRSPT